MFGGAYVVDNFALVLKALFLVGGLRRGAAVHELHRGRRLLGGRVLLAAAVVDARHGRHGHRPATSITIFVALELLSIPAYMLAGWRKRDLHGNEAGVKYYLMGVFASAVMLYGMSLVFGVAGTTLLADIAAPSRRPERRTPVHHPRHRVRDLGFAFKVSAVPFHTWAPDTYEGAPTPITAFLAVLSKAAGFVALLQLIVLRLRRPAPTSSSR